jgi:hypothetical protein
MSNKNNLVEILNPYNHDEPITRMKIEALKKNLGDKFIFSELNVTSKSSVILINSLLQQPLSDEGFRNLISEKRSSAITMLFIADFYKQAVSLLKDWSQYIDIFLVPTIEMKNIVQVHTSSKVEALVDPIDFNLQSYKTKKMSNSPIKVCWFGFPESYKKSMTEFETSIVEMNITGEIDYHIISKNDSYGKSTKGFGTIHEYRQETFLELLENFDVCVLSHHPLDFDINTYIKSENKAVLAINCGLPVVASSTPAYSRLLNQCGLSEFLFSSTEELKVAIKKMQSLEIRENYLKKSQSIILNTYSGAKMAEQWMKIYESALLTRQGDI